MGIRHARAQARGGSVLIVRSTEGSVRFVKMPIGFDGSPGAEIALRQSMLLAKQLSSDIHVIWIDECHDRGPGEREKGNRE